jgi:hypothetical protein
LVSGSKQFTIRKLIISKAESLSDLGTITGIAAFTAGVPSAVVSGTDIKTINGSSILGSGDIRSVFTIKTSAYNLAHGDSIAADTTTAAFTLTLPSSPTAGMSVKIVDYAGTFATNNLTIARNGANINGLAEDLTCNTKNLSITLNYIDATQGWRII